MTQTAQPVTLDTPTATLHFAHANGFPAGSYQSLFYALPDTFRVEALDKFGHNPQFPVDKDWAVQAQELVAHLEKLALGPVYAVGHSFGAVISYIAACNRPDVIKGLIMLDPPLVTGFTRVLAKLAKGTPLFDRFTPAKQAQTRNHQWPQDMDLVEYFRNKALFKSMDIRCIRDYVSSATEQTQEGQRLTFDRNVEADLFRTVPLNIHRYYGKLQVPALLVTGEKTRVSIPAMITPFMKHNNIDHTVVKGGGHMFPLEQPQEVAAIVQQQIERWQRQGDQ